MTNRVPGGWYKDLARTDTVRDVVVTITLRSLPDGVRLTVYGSRPGSRPDGRPLWHAVYARGRYETVQVALERVLCELAGHPEWIWETAPEKRV